MVTCLRTGIWRSVIQDVARSYTVFIDGVAEGKIWTFQTKSFEIATRRHEFRLKIVDTGRSCSDPSGVDVAPRGRVVFRTHFRGSKNLLMLPFAMPEGTAALARAEKLESNTTGGLGSGFESRGEPDAPDHGERSD